MAEALNVFLRWLHVAAAALLVGGMFYGRLVPPESQERAARAFQPVVLAAILSLLLSGLWNIFNNPGHSTRYWTVLALKLLLALHIFAVALIVARPRQERRGRLMTGTAVSGLIVILLSAWLRRIF